MSSFLVGLALVVVVMLLVLGLMWLQRPARPLPPKPDPALVRLIEETAARFEALVDEEVTVALLPPDSLKVFAKGRPEPLLTASVARLYVECCQRPEHRSQRIGEYVEGLVVLTRERLQ